MVVLSSRPQSVVAILVVGARSSHFAIFPVSVTDYAYWTDDVKDFLESAEWSFDVQDGIVLVL